MKIATLITLIGFTLFGSLSFAGNEGSGGGDILICKVEGRYKAYLADTYNVSHLANDRALQQGVSEEAYLEAILEMLQAEDTELAAAVRAKIAAFDLVPVKKLKDLKDDNIVVPKGCKKKQLARQTLGGGARIRIEYVASFLQLLMPADRSFFKVHEALIAIRNFEGDTTPIRRKVEALAKNGKFEDFLVATILKHRVIKPYALHRAYGITTGVWGLGMLLDFTPSQNYSTYISDRKNFRNLFDSQRMEGDAGALKLQSAKMAFFTFFKSMFGYGKGVSVVQLIKFYETSPDVFSFALKVAAAEDSSLVPWESVDAVKEEDVRNSLKMFLEKAPAGVRELESELRADMERYIALLQSMKERDAQSPLGQLEK